jgi:protein-S-isoprenylcysteine O-methyltransferase Ste14
MLKGFIGGFANLALVAALLLVPAGLVPGGTWFWPRALVFLGVNAAVSVAAILFLALRAPDSLAARLRKPVSRKQPVADRIVTATLLVSFFAWLAFIPLDVFYWRFLPPPGLPAAVCGALLYLFGFAVSMAAVFENSFAIPIVEDQTERGQVLVDTGLYARVRHPIYLGAVVYFAGAALWLGSYAALLATPVLTAVLVARIAVEEKTLRQKLPGYAEYMQRVPYRLAPHIW